jgi:hypothetical protein
MERLAAKRDFPPKTSDEDRSCGKNAVETSTGAPKRRKKGRGNRKEATLGDLTGRPSNFPKSATS